MLKKVSLVVVALLVTASLAIATPVIKLGDASGVFGAGNTNVSTVAVGGLYEAYIWVSSDLVGTSGTAGLDNAQVFLQYNSALVNLNGGTIASLEALAGNPFGTVWTGPTTGTLGGLDYASGALLPSANVSAIPLTKIIKATFKVAALGATSTVTLTADAGDEIHQSFVVNSANGDSQFFAASSPSQSVTFTPEPATMALLGLGGLLLRKKK